MKTKYIKLYEDFIYENPITLDKFKELPDLDVALKLPQVGSKRYNFTIENGKIISDDLKPNTKYDFLIMINGELIIGSQHYKMSKKAQKIKVSGELILDNNGKIKYLNNESGHYKPSKELLKSIIPLFDEDNLLSPEFKAEFLY